MKKINSYRTERMDSDILSRSRSALYIILITILVLLLSACGSNSTPTVIPTVVLQGGSDDAIVKPVSNSGGIIASALIVPAQEAHLAFVSGGNIAKVNVKVGDKVNAGQVLVELDNTLAQLEVERAERTLRELTSPAALAAAEESLANAQETYDDAKKKMDSLGRRFADNVTTDYLEAQLVLAQDALDLARDAYNLTSGKSDLDPARAKAATNLYNAQKAYNTALGNLNWYTEKPSANETALITAQFNSASAALQEAQWYLAELKGESIPADATGAQLAALQQARDNLQAAQSRLDQTRLLAPFDGVVAVMDAIAGSFAVPGQSLIVLVDMRQLQVKTTDLSERDIVNVQVGIPAIITVEALGDEYEGKVISISPLANTLGGDVVYQVTIAFNAQPEGVLGGMSAEVSIGE